MDDWQEMLVDHGPLVWRTAYRLLANEADAADCCQDTLISALRMARRESIENWPALLQRLTTTRALDLLRRRVRRSREQVAPDWEQLPAPERDPGQRAEDTELMERLRGALSRLSPQQSETFCLRHLNGLTYEQIAEQMNVTVNAVGVNLYRARQSLRGLLSGLAADVRE